MKLSSTTLLIAVGLSTVLVIVSIVGAVASFYWRLSRQQARIGGNRRC